MKKKPFHESVKEFIFGKDEKKLGKIGLARNNEYRVFSGLYMIRTTKIPEEEVSEMINFLKRVMATFENPKIKDLANKIIEEIILEKISKK